MNSKSDHPPTIIKHLSELIAHKPAAYFRNVNVSIKLK